MAPASAIPNLLAFTLDASRYSQDFKNAFYRDFTYWGEVLDDYTMGSPRLLFVYMDRRGRIVTINPDLIDSPRLVTLQKCLKKRIDYIESINRKAQAKPGVGPIRKANPTQGCHFLHFPRNY